MTLLKSEIQYISMDRKSVNNKRCYLTPDGNAVSSVTTILDATKDKTHLIEWRNKVGHVRAQEITTQAASTGTRMHKFLEDYIQTGEWPTPGSNPYSIHANKMANVIKEHGLTHLTEIWGIEVALYIPQIYAGTTDCIAKYKNNLSIIDYKQSNKPKKKEWIDDYFLQLVLYAMAHNDMYNTNINEGHIFMCTQSLEYQQFDLWPDEFDYWKHRAWDRVYQYYSLK